jgi:hypothetical protein
MLQLCRLVLVMVVWAILGIVIGSAFETRGNGYLVRQLELCSGIVGALCGLVVELRFNRSRNRPLLSISLSGMLAATAIFAVLITVASLLWRS